MPSRAWRTAPARCTTTCGPWNPQQGPCWDNNTKPPLHFCSGGCHLLKIQSKSILRRPIFRWLSPHWTYISSRFLRSSLPQRVLREIDAGSAFEDSSGIAEVPRAHLTHHGLGQEERQAICDSFQNTTEVFSKRFQLLFSLCLLRDGIRQLFLDSKELAFRLEDLVFQAWDSLQLGQLPAGNQRSGFF